MPNLIWSFLNHKQVTNYWKSRDKTPAKNKESENMSKALKARGFQFVEPTICYVFMQAIGMVNDHITSCFRHSEIAN